MRTVHLYWELWLRDSLELCFARYLSLHFFFFPNGLQEGLPCEAALLLLADRLQAQTKPKPICKRTVTQGHPEQWHTCDKAGVDYIMNIKYRNDGDPGSAVSSVKLFG